MFVHSSYNSYVQLYRNKAMIYMHQNIFIFAAYIIDAT